MNKITGLLLLGYVVIGAAFVQYKGGLPWLEYKLNRSHPAATYATVKQSVYDVLPVGNEDVVFVGDSILDYGEWGELMGDPRCKNRAINGSTIHDTEKALDRILSGHPATIVISAGINDLQSNADPSKVQEGRMALLSKIAEQSHSTKVILLPLFAPNAAKYQRNIIPNFPGIHMPTLEECQAVDSRSQIIPDEWTDDGLHLNGQGLVNLSGQIKAQLKSSSPN